MSKKHRILIYIVAAFVAGIFFTTAGANLFDGGDRLSAPATASVLPKHEVPIKEDLSRTTLADFETVFITVAEEINPTVVQIHSERVVQTRPSSGFEGTPFENFFNFNTPNGQAPEMRTQALGSGVIVRQDGYIVTNNHVIDQAEDLQVTLLDGTVYDAELVGADPGSDLAVIKVEKDGLPFLTIPEVSDARVGEWALAFGSPLSDDLGNTVTAGIVSAVRRTSSQITQLNAYAAFIQTDAAINPGNSGGPLVNLRGELMGINSAIYSRTGGSQGIGFAIPAEVVHNVVEQLIESGEVERAALGVEFNAVSRSLSEALDVPPAAAQIVRVTPGTPAEEAGLEQGDIVIAVNGEALRGANELRTIIGNQRPGNTVRLEIVRDGEHREIDVTLGRFSDLFAEAVGDSDSTPNQNASPATNLGFSVSNLSDQIRMQFGDDAADLQGVVIRSIDQASDAYRDADLRQGDIITRIGDRPVANVADFERIYENLDVGKAFVIQVTRPTTSGDVSRFFTALTKPE